MSNPKSACPKLQIVNSCYGSDNQVVSVPGVEQRFEVPTQTAMSIAKYLASDICSGIDYTGLPYEWKK